MSTWTEETHVRARCAVEEGDIDGENGWAVAYLADALDEIQRLRAESARRMVWLETAQRALEHANAALMDMTEHAAHPEITDDMAERAGFALFRRTFGKTRTTENARRMWDSKEVSGGVRESYRRRARVALEAALKTKENEA